MLFMKVTVAYCENYRQRLNVLCEGKRENFLFVKADGAYNKLRGFKLLMFKRMCQDNWIGDVDTSGITFLRHFQRYLYY
jgi:hypothetical protein